MPGLWLTSNESRNADHLHNAGFYQYLLEHSSRRRSPLMARSDSYLTFGAGQSPARKARKTKRIELADNIVCLHTIRIDNNQPSVTEVTAISNSTTLNIFLLCTSPAFAKKNAATPRSASIRRIYSLRNRSAPNQQQPLFSIGLLVVCDQPDKHTQICIQCDRNSPVNKQHLASTCLFYGNHSDVVML